MSEEKIVNLNSENLFDEVENELRKEYHEEAKKKLRALLKRKKDAETILANCIRELEEARELIDNGLF